MTDNPTVTVRRGIDAPIETVWTVATDLNDMPERMSVITGVDVLQGGDAFGVGTRWRETRVMMRREATVEMWVSELEKHRAYTVEADNAGVHYISTFTFTPVGDDATDVSMSFTGQPTSPPNVIMRLMGKLGLRVVRKSLEKDLEDIAKAAEDATVALNPT